MSAQKNDGQGEGANHVTWEILWLNSIVLAWGHDAFRDLLLDKKTTRDCLGAVLAGICPQGGTVRQLSEFAKGLKGRDRALAAIQKQVADSRTKLDTILPPWVRLEVRACPKDGKGQGFGYSGDSGWFLPRVEVTVPLPKESVGAGQAEVEYLICEMTTARMGGWPFDGGGGGARTAARAPKASALLRAAAPVGAAAPPAAHGAFESPIPAFEQTHRWFYVWTRVLASATPGSPLRQRLMKDPALALLDEFGFSVPSGTSIKFTEKSIKDKYRIAVTMYLPSAPKEDYRAVALANYAEMGRTYPFTLCFC